MFIEYQCKSILHRE